MALGRKTGGRRKGSLNRRTKAALAGAALAGLTPLDYMLSVLRDDKADGAARMDAAKAAAPYIHPRLAQVDGSGKNVAPVIIQITGSDKGLL